MDLGGIDLPEIGTSPLATLRTTRNKNLLYRGFGRLSSKVIPIYPVKYPSKERKLFEKTEELEAPLTPVQEREQAEPVISSDIHGPPDTRSTIEPPIQTTTKTKKKPKVKQLTKCPKDSTK